METLLRNFKINRFWVITTILIILKLTIHLLTCTRYELLRDEMLFFNMGEHLDFGYATVPPVTGFLALLMHKLFGFSVAGIRLFPALMGAVSIYLIALLVRDLGGGIQALIIAGSTYLLTTGFLLVSSLFTPNSLDELIWLTATLLIFRMVRDKDPKRWIWISIVLATGFLNKYSVIFFIAGFIPALILEEKHYLFRSKYFIAGILLAFLIILPNLIWQYNHSWPVLAHMDELRNSQLNLLGYSGFLEYLFSFSQGSVIIWLAGLISLLFLKSEKEYRYLGIATVLIMLLFFIMKGKGYYVLGLLPFLFAFAGYVMEKYLNGSKRIIKWVAFTLSLLISAAALPSGLPILSLNEYDAYLRATGKFICHPMMRWDNGEKHSFPQAYADMTGWKNLAGIAAKAYYSLPDEERGKCLIYCERSYGYAGAIYFYGREHLLPQAVTFHESYTYWAPDSIPSGPVIYINEDINGFDELFSEIVVAGEMNDKYFRENGLKVFLCRSPKKDISTIYAEKAREEKRLFSRKRT